MTGIESQADKWRAERADWDARCALRCLAANLATAGGLCASFGLGDTYRSCIEMKHNTGIEVSAWSPGCNIKRGT